MIYNEDAEVLNDRFKKFETVIVRKEPVLNNYHFAVPTHGHMVTTSLPYIEAFMTRHGYKYKIVHELSHSRFL